MLRFEDNVNNNTSFIKASTTVMNGLISYKKFKEIEEVSTKLILFTPFLLLFCFCLKITKRVQ